MCLFFPWVRFTLDRVGEKINTWTSKRSTTVLEATATDICNVLDFILEKIYNQDF